MSTLAHIDLKSLLPSSSSSPEQQQESPAESQIVTVLDATLNGPVPTELAAESTAGELDKLYPAGKGGEVAEDFLWRFWTVLIGAAKHVPAQDLRLQLLALVVGKLKSRTRETVELWGNDTAVWGDLPMLGPCMREAWNERPGFKDTDPEAAARWVSLNSFAARVLGTSSTDWVNFAVWELRSALEEEAREGDAPAALDMALGSACEWLTHAGAVLRQQGRDAKALDDAEARSLKPGSLFREKDGKPGLSEERWAFWKQRLASLSAEAGNARLKQSISRVVEGM